MTRIGSIPPGAKDALHRFDGAEQLRLIADSLPVLISYIDANERYLFTNAAHERTVGVDRTSILGRHVDDVVGRILSAPTYATVKRHMATALAGREVEYELEYRSRDGDKRCVNGVYIPHRDDAGDVIGFFSLVTDITDRRRWESMHRGEAAVLEHLATGSPLADVLHALTLQIEAQGDGMIASVLLLDGQHLRQGAAPHLPEAYNRVIDGLPIGPRAGSCGTAAYRGERVIVADTFIDPLWADYRDVARAHGLRACWSQPIFGSDGSVLGTFASYYRTPRRPSEADCKLIESAAHVAGIAIERSRSELALRNEQQLLQTLMDNAADAIYFKDLASRFVRVNRAQTGYLGLGAPDEAIGRTDADFFPDETAGRYRADEEDVVATGRPIIGKIEDNGAGDERRRWFSTTKVPFRKADGSIIGTIGISRDITELKRLEEALRNATEEVEEQVRDRTAELRVALARLHRASAQRRRAETVLRESEDRYRLLHEGVQYVVWEFDEAEDRFDFVGVGHHARDLLGFSVDAWKRPGFWRKRLHPDDRDWVIQLSREHRDASQDHEFEYRLVSRGGETVWIKDLTTIVSHRDGKAVRTRGIFIDITERKRAEEQAKENQARLARASNLSTLVLMAASLSHELNQPLQAIMTFAETCSRELDSAATDHDLVRADLGQIVTHAQRAADIMCRLRNFSRSELPRPVPADVNEIVRGVLDLLGPTARHAGVSVETNLLHDLPEVPLDIVQFEKAIQNLANNAIEAMGAPNLDRRVLTIETRVVDGDEIEISVRDTGPGIPDAALANVFEPFYTTKSKGMGLGLSLARRIVKMHGGRLDVTNDAAGGASFTIRVPRSRPEVAD